VTVRSRPFYLPREFTSVIVIGVYIPPSANAKEALGELYGAISELQNAYPDGLFIVAGDFNHANLKSVLPKFHQYVDFATRGANMLDLVYTNIPGAYRGAPQGCVLSPLLFTLLTHDCAAKHSSNHLIKFADDTTVVGLISQNDESAYRKVQSDHSPLNIDGSLVEIVRGIKFLGVHLTENLTWRVNTSSITKKAQQRLCFLRRLRKAHLPPPILTTFYRGTIESILSGCITAWFGTCTTADQKSLQRIVRTAEKIIGVSLPSIKDIYTQRCIRRATSIVGDPTHPSYSFFNLLPSGRRYRSIRARTTRLGNSFYPEAVRLLNTQELIK
ncbi:hypothetical protein PO909_002405, partial [Leuciscus waleckii]